MKHSGDPWTASNMLVNNKPHEAGVRAFLSRIVHEPQAHGRFLNMLSMLEHMGSRKIMVSQMKRPETMSQDTLQHLAEEARHAYFFKRHAERIFGGDLTGWVDENTMCRVPALMYFGRMDAGITRRVQQGSSRWRASEEACAQTESLAESLAGSGEGARQSGSPLSKDADASRGDDDSGEPYGWVSLIIELRACWLYKIYDEVVDAEGVHLPLKGLLAEEDHHLAEMFEMCGEDHDCLRELSAYETELFVKMWTALEVAFPAADGEREAA